MVLEITVAAIKHGKTDLSSRLGARQPAPRASQFAKRKCITSPSEDDVILALEPELSRFARAGFRHCLKRSRHRAMVSARMKPFSKSVWMTPAACGARGAARDGPGARFLRAGGEIGDEIEQSVSQRGSAGRGRAP